MRKKNTFKPLSEEELEDVLIELRTNDGSDDPFFILKGGDNHEKNSTGIHQSVHGYSR